MVFTFLKISEISPNDANFSCIYKLSITFYCDMQSALRVHLQYCSACEI